MHHRGHHFAPVVRVKIWGNIRFSATLNHSSTPFRSYNSPLHRPYAPIKDGRGAGRRIGSSTRSTITILLGPWSDPLQRHGSADRSHSNLGVKWFIEFLPVCGGGGSPSHRLLPLSAPPLEAPPLRGGKTVHSSRRDGHDGCDSSRNAGDER
jgi:hypothetical protein